MLEDILAQELAKKARGFETENRNSEFSKDLREILDEYLADANEAKVV